MGSERVLKYGVGGGMVSTFLFMNTGWQLVLRWKEVLKTIIFLPKLAFPFT